MKITCNSCGSKYTIADAKVQGRKVKVRCKSCKSTILVDGTVPQDPSSDGDGEALDVAGSISAPPAALRRDAWSVNLSDDDSRDMSTAELIAGWKSGLVTTDAYAWKDGMDDWKPLLEIPELRQKLLAAKPLQSEGVVSSAALPANQRAGGGADLFGGVDLAGSDVDMGGAHPSLPAGGGSKKGSGARNESSVLFSLDALTGGGVPGVPPTTSSGAVDLFGGMGGGGGALFANTELLTAPAKEPPPAPRVSIPALASGAPGAQKGKGGLIVAILAAAVIVAGGLAFALGGASGPSEAELAAAKAAEEATAKAEAEAKQKAAEAEKMAAELKKAREALEKAKDDGQKPTEGGKDDGAKGDPKAGATAPSDSGSTAAASTSAAASSAPATSDSKPGFNVSAAKAALASAAANAARCKTAGGPSGSGKVQITFAPSGRATSAQVVSGPFGGTAVGSCVASTFRQARVPPFSGDAKTVAKSFTIP